MGTYEILNKINVSDRVKQKMGLKYLSWADAWNILKKTYPNSEWKIYDREVHTTKKITEVLEGETVETVVDEGIQRIPYFTDGKSCFVKVGLIIEGVEYIEIYPVMDLKNNAVSARRVTFTDVNKAIQRAFVKCAARHGLGINLYTGEDFPEEEEVLTLTNGSDFASVQKDVISLIKELSKNDSKMDEVSRYIKELFGDKRISQTTSNDLKNLELARTYLNKLYLGE